MPPIILHVSTINSSVTFLLWGNMGSHGGRLWNSRKFDISHPKESSLVYPHANTFMYNPAESWVRYQPASCHSMNWIQPCRVFRDTYYLAPSRLSNKHWCKQHWNSNISCVAVSKQMLGDVGFVAPSFFNTRANTTCDECLWSYKIQPLHGHAQGCTRLQDQLTPNLQTCAANKTPFGAGTRFAWHQQTA